MLKPYLDFCGYIYGFGCQHLAYELCITTQKATKYDGREIYYDFNNIFVFQIGPSIHELYHNEFTSELPRNFYL